VENQYSLCLKVLRRLKEAGVLDEIMVIGSWCIYFYKNYFTEADYTSSIRTRDIDFLMPRRLKRKGNIDLPMLFRDLGFVVDFSPKGAFRLVHPELITFPRRWKSSILRALELSDAMDLFKIVSQVK